MTFLSIPLIDCIAHSDGGLGKEKLGGLAFSEGGGQAVILINHEMCPLSLRPPLSINPLPNDTTEK